MITIFPHALDCLEPMVTEYQQKALALAVGSKMPKLQEFVPRRILLATRVPHWHKS